VTSGEPMRRVAVVRPPGASFARALSEHPDRATIDLARAAGQHAAYREALRRAGLHLVRLPPDEELPVGSGSQPPSFPPARSTCSRG